MEQRIESLPATCRHRPTQAPLHALWAASSFAEPKRSGSCTPSYGCLISLSRTIWARRLPHVLSVQVENVTYRVTSGAYGHPGTLRRTRRIVGPSVCARPGEG